MILKRHKRPIVWDDEYVRAAQIIIKALENMGADVPEKLRRMAGEQSGRTTET